MRFMLLNGFANPKHRVPTNFSDKRICCPVHGIQCHSQRLSVPFSGGHGCSAVEMGEAEIESILELAMCVYLLCVCKDEDLDGGQLSSGCKLCCSSVSAD